MKKQIEDLSREDEPKSPSFFSTHWSPKKQWKIDLEMQKKAFPITASNFKTADGVGMDDVNLNSAKNAFVFGLQRIPQNLFAWYVSQGFIGYQACALIAQQWLVNKACAMKGEDAVRNGFEITINDGTEADAELIAAIKKADKRYKLKHNLRQADLFKNVFGIRHVLFVVDSPDKDYYLKPFNPDGIRPGTYRGMSQIDPYWITPLLDADAVSNPKNQHFYEPTYWQISGQKIHHSHFVILKGPEVSDVLKPSYIYAGLPLTQRIMERVYAAERTANEAPILAMTKRLNVWKMDLSKAIANQKEFESTLEWQTQTRDNHGIMAAGLTDEVTQLETALTDLDEVIMTQYQIVAGIAEVPATKLMGTSPKGFQSTGEHEITTYHEKLETLQENDLSPIVERHHICVMRSEIGPRFNAMPEIEINWLPINVPSGKELAEINTSKAAADAQLITTGAVDAYDIRDRLIADKDSGYSGLEKLERPEVEDLDDFDLGETEGNETETDQILELKEDPAAQATAKQEAEKAEDTKTVTQVENRWYVVDAADGKTLAGPYSNSKKARNRLRKLLES